MLGENTEITVVSKIVPSPSRWRNARFDWTGDSLHVKVQFTAQADLESKLFGFQPIPLILLSYSESNDRLLVPSFSFLSGEKNRIEFLKKKVPREQWRKEKIVLATVRMLWNAFLDYAYYHLLCACADGCVVYPCGSVQIETCQLPRPRDLGLTDVAPIRKRASPLIPHAKTTERSIECRWCW